MFSLIQVIWFVILENSDMTNFGWLIGRLLGGGARGKGVWPRSSNWCLWEPENGSGFTADTAVCGPGNTDWVRVYLDLCITQL